MFLGTLAAILEWMEAVIGSCPTGDGGTLAPHWIQGVLDVALKALRPSGWHSGEAQEIAQGSDRLNFAYTRLA